jgi:cbb3-type cytochrome c oxidase subunit III
MNYQNMFKPGPGILALFVLSALPLQKTLAADSIDAAAIYHQYCSVCHGDKGDGQSRARQGLVPPPRDFTMAGLATTLSRENMIDVVTHGRTGTAMVGWGTRLNTQEVAAVVDYIRSTFMQVTKSGSTAKISSRGATIYNESCSVCHGDNGAGSLWASSNLNPPPRNFTLASIPREQLIHSITNGRAGTAMPAFKTQYSKEDIASVADYILQSFSPQPPKQAANNKLADTANKTTASFMQLPYPGDLKPDLAAGKALYLANCVTCHGETGAGNGPRAYFIFPKPRNFLSDTVRKTFNRPALYNAVKNGVKGKEMPAWDKVLTAQQIVDVSEYVFQAFITADK